jgi:hypothetical protein
MDIRTIILAFTSIALALLVYDYVTKRIAPGYLFAAGTWLLHVWLFFLFSVLRLSYGNAWWFAGLDALGLPAEFGNLWSLAIYLHGVLILGGVFGAVSLWKST